MERRWAVMVLGLVLAVSSVMIPKNYKLPKQDYRGARNYVERRIGPSERAVAIGLAGDLFACYYAPDWYCAKTGAELKAAMRDSRRVWLVYTMPIHVRAYHPDIWAIVQREFETAEVFPGTLSGGELFVCKSQPVASDRSGPDQGTGD
jgi:hypothetical protein